jgi:tight adherence protein C
MDMVLTITLLAFTAAFALVLGVGALLETDAVAARLARLGRTEDANASAGSLLTQSDTPGWLRPIMHIGQRQAAGRDVGPLRERLIHAGYRRRSAPALFLGLRIALGLGLPALVAVAPLAWNPSHFQLVLALCIATGIGFIAPSVWLDARKDRRQKELRRALPDALDLMVVCVEAGYAINASLARVAQEFAEKTPVLSEELSLVTAETAAGKSLTEALRALSDRTGVDDVSSLVALLVQTERFGTSVADALRVHADAIRIRRMQQAEERAQKAPLKLILPATLIFLALMLVFMAPSMFRFSQAFPDS